MNEIIRDTIEGELNRIAVSDDTEEIIKMLGYLQLNVSKYAKSNLDRIRFDMIRKKRLEQIKKQTMSDNWFDEIDREDTSTVESWFDEMEQAEHEAEEQEYQEWLDSKVKEQKNDSSRID